MRIGHGYDVHKLIYGKKLILGGLEISNNKGLLGHSDADVLTHAIIDALLGASCLGDIGEIFPDTNELYKDSNSLNLLLDINLKLKEKGYKISNLDATVIAQKPKIKPYIYLMRKNLTDILSIPISCISIKATTEEGLGFTGNEEGIAAHCVCLIDTY